MDWMSITCQLYMMQRGASEIADFAKYRAAEARLVQLDAVLAQVSVTARVNLPGLRRSCG